SVGSCSARTEQFPGTPRASIGGDFANCRLRRQNFWRSKRMSHLYEIGHEDWIHNRITSNHHIEPVMRARFAQWLAGVLAAVASSGMTAASSGEPIPPIVYSADVDSIIHPVSAEYMIGTMARADRENAALVVFTLRTPGGLLDS